MASPLRPDRRARHYDPQEPPAPPRPLTRGEILREITQLTEGIAEFNSIRQFDPDLPAWVAARHQARVARRNELRALLATAEDDPPAP